LRTRPPRPSRNRPLRVNVISRDGLVLQRLAHAEGRGDLVVSASTVPLDVAQVDAYVVAAHDLHLLGSILDPREAELASPLVIAFGPAEHLRAAFLAGCADYLKEPWDLPELETRLVHATLTRPEEMSRAWGYVLEGRCLRLPDGREVKLSAHESVVAGLLFANQGAVVSRRALSFALWGKLPAQSSRAVDMHVSALRRKLGKDLISCVRGQGYVISPGAPR
jgi:hypothetical protein